MKKLNSKLLMGIATLATVFASVLSTSACFWYLYQPKEPKCLREK
ncbi:cyclic lactone autoinducer peptide [Eubacterium multiforme]|uniref:Cyclic lactone autoinducer peptide n=1 Tax=Eubacterium multiforme TaxID=83339 RepID=A0ABT9UNL8_9FIRM|nr:cyclic lactone autoinducer peptide [Eubacterium multiforme]MDQ0148233.1 cyclic lactone autoinducer peptide [Eubacterium multiforme]